MGKRQQQQKYLILALAMIVVIAGAGAYLYLSSTSTLTGISAVSTQEGSASTPYGESLEISLSSGAETSTGASWLASYSDSTSQNVYTVNGTYKSQEQVTLGYSLTVTYSNVESITITNLYIKAVDTSDASSYTYTLATSKALSGASPISDSGSTVKTIVQHLTDIVASTSGATVEYYIYAQVQATGSISGLTLTAEIPETKFTTLVYSQSSESTSANVTPSVNVASWTEAELIGTGLVVFGVALLVVVVYFAVAENKTRKRRRRRR